MTASTDLNAYRDRIHVALKQAGYQIDTWRFEYEAELASNPTARARPFTKITPPVYGKIKKLRPGFEEFIPHPAHGKPVPRCQAAKKRTGGKVQCGKFALKGKHLCRLHGGAAGSGRISDQGRETQRLSVTQNGAETVAIRARRSELSKQRRAMERQLRELGLQVPNMRGPRDGNFERYARYRAALERKAAKLRALAEEK